VRCELFEDDFEVVSYSSTEECLEKAKWLLDNPKRALEIGQNARRRYIEDRRIFYLNLQIAVQKILLKLKKIN
jgi:spore maturation protein CgeB